MPGKPCIRLNNLKTSLGFPCLGLNPIIDSINLDDPYNVVVSYFRCEGISREA